MKLGDLVRQYPALDHTFVLREVRALRRQGVMEDPEATRRLGMAARRKIVAVQSRSQRRASGTEISRPAHGLMPRLAARDATWYGRRGC